MERKGARFHGLKKSLRQDVLSGVLLHVVEAALPVDLSPDTVAFSKAAGFQKVVYLPILFRHPDHPFGVALSQVAWLASALGIKAASIQYHGAAARLFTHRDHQGVEHGDVNIREVKFFRCQP
jgi:hypothetical protein